MEVKLKVESVSGKVVRAVVNDSQMSGQLELSVGNKFQTNLRSGDELTIDIPELEEGSEEKVGVNTMTPDNTLNQDIENNED